MLGGRRYSSSNAPKIAALKHSYSFSFLSFSFLLDWATDNELTVFGSRLGRDKTNEGWALDIFPGCRSTTTEFEKETCRVGAKHCPEYGTPG